MGRRRDVSSGYRRAPFPRGERHDRSSGSHKSRGKVAGVRLFVSRPRVIVPVVRRPAGEPRNRMPPLPPQTATAAPFTGVRSLREMARAPASCGRVEDGLFTVCPDRRVARHSRVRSRFHGSSGSVANRSAPHQTRLETRTKESNMCASHWALRNPEAQ